MAISHIAISKYHILQYLNKDHCNFWIKKKRDCRTTQHYNKTQECGIDDLADKSSSPDKNTCYI